MHPEPHAVLEVLATVFTAVALLLIMKPPVKRTTHRCESANGGEECSENTLLTSFHLFHTDGRRSLISRKRKRPTAVYLTPFPGTRIETVSIMTASPGLDRSPVDEHQLRFVQVKTSKQTCPGW